MKNTARNRWLWATVLLTAVAFVVGCAVRRSLSSPLEHVDYRPYGTPSQTLIVFLPGIFDSGEMFREHGFLQAVQDRGIDADMTTVNAHVGYYGEGVIVERLRRDVIEPARRQGYRRIVLVGISMGGFGALLYTRAYPGDVDSVIVLAPLLSNDQKGARDPAELLTKRNRAEDLWPWLEEYPARARELPALYLAYGEQDKFAPMNARLAALLPAERVDRIPGEHDWPVWARLWERALARGWLTETPARATEAR